MTRYWLGWAALASTPVALSILFRATRTTGSGEDRGFDAFLVTRGDIDTGVVVASKKTKKKAKAAAGESGPIDNFFKVPQLLEADEEEDERDPAVFSTFLKSSRKGAAPSAAAKPAAAAKAEERPTPDMSKARAVWNYGVLYSLLEVLLPVAQLYPAHHFNIVSKMICAPLSHRMRA